MKTADKGEEKAFFVNWQAHGVLRLSENEVTRAKLWEQSEEAKLGLGDGNHIWYMDITFY